MFYTTQNERFWIYGIFEGEEALEKRRTETGYADAKALMEKGEYAAASKLFASVASYKDAEKQAKICEQKDLEQRTERTYTEAKNLMERGEFAAAKEKFMAVSGHQDADLLAKDCEEKEQLRRSELAYRQLLEKKARAKTVGDWTSLANLFMQMNDYKDTQAQAQYCSEQAAEVQRLIEEERRKELERRAIEERRRQLENEKKEQEAIACKITSKITYKMCENAVLFWITGHERFAYSSKNQADSSIRSKTAISKCRNFVVQSQK